MANALDQLAPRNLPNSGLCPINIRCYRVFMDNRQQALVGLGIVAGITIGVIGTLIIATGFGGVETFTLGYWIGYDGHGTRSEVVRNLGLLFVAIVGIVFAWLRWRNLDRQAAIAERQADTANEQLRIANEQNKLAERGHITERFNKAVEHLGNEKLSIRLGGIYALWRLIEEAPERDVESIVDILCAFVRHPTSDEDITHHESNVETDKSSDKKSKTLRPDVQTILTLLGKENAAYRSLMDGEISLNFGGADLRNSRLKAPNFRRAILAEADLSNSFIWHGDFLRANLSAANLSNSRLIRCNLSDATFRNVNFSKTKFSETNLTGANLQGAIDLFQAQIDQSVCIQNNPPNLPTGLTPPTRTPEGIAED